MVRHDFIACLDCSDIWDSSRAVHKSFISFFFSPQENISIVLLQERSCVTVDIVVHAEKDLKRHGFFFQDKGLLMPVQP